MTTKSRPIIFAAHSVREIITGRKTMTRRIVKDSRYCWASVQHCQQVEPNGCGGWRFFDEIDTGHEDDVCCPYGDVGDHLWVKETWSPHYTQHPRFQQVHYRADLPDDPSAAMTENHAFGLMQWKSPLFMKRSDSRITLEITAIHVERVQEITAADVVAEGYPFSSDLDQFKAAWSKINGAKSWAENPWVWVVEFRKIEQ